jgi:hypothetical protein
LQFCSAFHDFDSISRSKRATFAPTEQILPASDHRRARKSLLLVSGTASAPLLTTDNPAIADRKRQLKGVLMLSMVLLILLVALLVGALPSWPYSRSWGYYPSGVLTTVLVVVVVLALLGRI